MLFASVMFIGLNASVKVQKEVPEEVAEPGTSGRTLEGGGGKAFFELSDATCNW